MQTSIETLKQILQDQKTAIEKKGGTVTIKGTNVSPSEITEGIKSIAMPDFSNATATEADVLEGKTFYAIDASLKTGKFTELYSKEKVNALFFHPNNDNTIFDKVYSLTSPKEFFKVRDYLFYNIKNNCQITFSDETLVVGEYSFYGCTNFTFTNFTDCCVEEIQIHGFDGSTLDCLDCLPDSLTTLLYYCLANQAHHNIGVRFPPNIKTVEHSIFASDDYHPVLQFADFSQIRTSNLPTSAIQGIHFDCDFTPPAKITTINSNFNYRGSFNNLIIPNTIKSLSSNCFSDDSRDNPANCRLKTVTFESFTPPTIKLNIFPTYKTDYKIYVPDESVEEYKSVTNLKQYADKIFPVSQKE